MLKITTIPLCLINCEPNLKYSDIWLSRLASQIKKQGINTIPLYVEKSEPYNEGNQIDWDYTVVQGEVTWLAMKLLGDHVDVNCIVINEESDECDDTEFNASDILKEDKLTFNLRCTSSQI